MSRHDYLYRECRECSCADGECHESRFDKALGILGIIAAVGLILLLAMGPGA